MQLVEVILAEDLFTLLQTFVIQNEALDDELPQRLRRPDAELRGLMTVHPVADGDDGIEVVELQLACDLTSTFGSNYFHFGNIMAERMVLSRWARVSRRWSAIAMAL